jgi:hypothetical protein
MKQRAAFLTQPPVKVVLIRGARATASAADWAPAGAGIGDAEGVLDAGVHDRLHHTRC